MDKAQNLLIFRRMSISAEIAAVVFRGECLEAVHYASIAVVNESGNLTHYLGNPEFTCMTRSCIKPFQLMPLVASGTAEEFGYEGQRLAIMAGSHNGSDEHRKVVRENLHLAGNSVDHLQCGSHWPIGMEERKRWPLRGEEKDPLRHNCSGKHSGFLALARRFKTDVERYLSPESDVQRKVLKAVSNYCEFPRNRMAIGIDGCSAPNFPLSLQAIARGFVRLITARAAADIPSETAARISEAMMTHPEMVSGEGRFDLALSKTFPGRLVCKVGAEAIEGIAITDPPAGIAVKIHDGNWRALWPVCIEVLRQLGYIEDIAGDSLLARFARPEVRNARELLTGYIVPEFQLKKV